MGNWNFKKMVLIKDKNLTFFFNFFFFFCLDFCISFSHQSRSYFGFLHHFFFLIQFSGHVKAVVPTIRVKYVKTCQDEPRKICSQTPRQECHKEVVPLCKVEPRETCVPKEKCKSWPKKNCGKNIIIFC